MKYSWNLNDVEQAVVNSINFTEVLEKLNIPRQGNNSKTLRKILDENNIDYSHFTGRARFYTTNYVPVEQYLSNTKKIHSSKLKEKLLKEGLINNCCSICGLTEWNNKPLILQLHHIDGDHNNNNLNNLQLLCPNCHSQTENYCGSANKNIVKYYCKDCGKEIKKNSIYCSVCAAKYRRKVVRPELSQLIQDFKVLKSYTQVGLKYNVSDNTIRKWVAYYGLPKNIKNLNLYISKIKICENS